MNVDPINQNRVSQSPPEHPQNRLASWVQPEKLPVKAHSYSAGAIAPKSLEKIERAVLILPLQH